MVTAVCAGLVEVESDANRYWNIMTATNFAKMEESARRNRPVYPFVSARRVTEAIIARFETCLHIGATRELRHAVVTRNFEYHWNP